MITTLEIFSFPHLFGLRLLRYLLYVRKVAIFVFKQGSSNQITVSMERMLESLVESLVGSLSIIFAF